MFSGGGGSIYGREVPLSDSYLATLPSSELDPEAQLIAAEEAQALLSEPATEVPPVLSERLLAILSDFLPPEETYLLEAYYVRGQHQSAMAQRLGVNKQSIQYRLQRALERTRWALTLETWNRSEQEMREDLGGILKRAEVRFTFILWRHRWNQSRTAQWLGWKQQLVGVRVQRLHLQLTAHVEIFSVAPYARDLARVIDARAWCMGSGQHQGNRAIKFPRFTKKGRGRR
jgi:transposase